MKLVPSIFVSIVSAIACVGAAGCSTETSDLSDEIGASSQALGQTVDVPNPSNAYFAKVNAFGSGCLPGTWEAGISPDGKAFTLTFNAYEAVVDPGQATSIKDCTISIDLQTPPGFSFSVSSFYYQGYADLDEPGMTAKQSAKYYFRGNPVPARELRTELSGPFSDSYMFSDHIGLADLVWSPCGASRTLNALTRIVVKNNQAKTGSGYVNTAVADGEIRTPLKFTFGLDWKQC